MRNIFKIILFFLATQIIFGQESENSDQINLSKFGVISGELKNGFRYYIKPLDDGGDKIYTKLIINAGSFQEDEDQYAIAHLLEHMVFNSTENFPDLRNNAAFYSKLNIVPQDLRAQTGGNNTQYSIRFPKNTFGNFDTILSIYHDIADGKVKFEEAAIEGERKALLHEKIDGVDPADMYPSGKILFYLTGCNDIPEPKELKQKVMNSSTQALKRFYNDWYRPDLMDLVIVGKIENIEEIERKIKRKFNDIEVPARPKQNKDCNQKYLTSSEHFIRLKKPGTAESDPRTIWQFFYRSPSLFFEDFSQKQNEKLWDILSEMIRNRLINEQQNYNINYLSTFYSEEGLPASKLVISTNDNSEEAIQKVYNILAGISEYGFTKAEWQVVIKNRSNAELGNSAENWMDALKNFIIDGEELPNDKNRYLKSLELKTINKLINEISWRPDDIAVILPNGIDSTNLAREKVQSWIGKALKKPKKYSPIVAPKQLMSPKEVNDLKKARIVTRSFGPYNEDIIKLENGVTIILKDFNPDSGKYQDKIMVQGFSPYGASCFGLENTELILAPLIIQHSGVGPYNKFEIDKLLSHTSFQYNFRDYIKPHETGLYAQLSSEDMETLLQLIYLSFTNPRYDQEACKDWKKYAERLSRQSSNANNDFNDFLKKTNGIIKIPHGIELQRLSQKVNYKEAFKKYRALHSDAKNFTFVFTGKFRKKEILPVLVKYLGNLPNTDKKQCSKFKEKKFNHPKGNETNVSYKLPYPVDNCLFSIQYRTKWNPKDYKEAINTELLRAAIDLKVKDLRFNKNFGTYTAVGSVNLNYDDNFKIIQAYVLCNTEDYNKILKICNEYIEELKAGKISDHFLELTKESAYLSKWKDNFDGSNGDMQEVLYDHYRYGIPFVENEKIKKYIHNFGVDDLQKIALKYLEDNSKRVLTACSDAPKL